MKLSTIATRFCGVLVVLVSGLIKFNPYFLLYVPKIGPLLWVTLGFPVPPYFDNEAFKYCDEDYNRDSHCSWLKPDSVVVSACAKCGTNWILTTVHELRTWDKPGLKDFGDILDIAPWPDLNQFPGDEAKTHHHHWGTIWNQTELKFPIFKTHLAANLLPVKKRRDVRYIVIVRDPADAIFSFTQYAPKISSEWIKLWGEITRFTPDLGQVLDFYKYFPSSSPFNFFSTWLDYRGEPNVLMLHYKNYFENQEEYIHKIADFLRLPVDDESFKVASHRLSLEFMKKQNQRYLYLAGYDGKTPFMKNNTMVRKGGVGEGHEKFSQKELDAIEEIGLNSIGKVKLQMLKDGFN